MVAQRAPDPVFFPAPAGPAATGRSRRAAACFGWLFLASAAATAQVLINPVLVELGPQQRSASVLVTLSDKAPAPMRLQADVLQWQQDLDGGDLTQPSTDLLVTPPIADLKPGQKQLFRVALRGGRRAPGELAYRLILEDVAPPRTAMVDAQGLAIKFRMRYDLPVLVAPAVPVQNRLRWKSCAPAVPAKACLRLLNAGNRRVKVNVLTLAGDGWQQALAMKEGVNVLAGAEREWQVALEPGHAGPVRAVQVRTARGEDLQAEAANE